MKPIDELYVTNRDEWREWLGKSDPTAEVIAVQLRRRDDDNWETVGRLAVYRTSDGVYSKLPERK